MPLTRYQIRNEYSLADPDLNRAADKDDPEALLEGVAMSGLVGVLRQLGDPAESVSLSLSLSLSSVFLLFLWWGGGFLSGFSFSFPMCQLINLLGFEFCVFGAEFLLCNFDFCLDAELLGVQYTNQIG